MRSFPMPINTHCGAEGFVGPFDDIEKIVHSNIAWPSTLLKAAEVRDNIPTERYENTLVRNSCTAKILAKAEAARKVSEKTARHIPSPKEKGL